MTPPESRRIETVRAWIASARADLDALEILEAEGPLLVIGFHAQQAVEKLLKALLIAHGVEPEDTHLIGSLVGQLHRLDRATAQALGSIERLAPYAVLHRYPPRAGRSTRPLERSSVLADLVLARAACETLDRAVSSRLAAFVPPGRAEGPSGTPQAE